MRGTAPPFPNKIRRYRRKSNGSPKKKGVLNVAHANGLTVHQHPDHVEPVRPALNAKPVHPDLRRPDELALFPPVHGEGRIGNRARMPRLYLHEDDGVVCLDYQVDIAMPIAEAPPEKTPPLTGEPPLGDPLAQFPQKL